MVHQGMTGVGHHFYVNAATQAMVIDTSANATFAGEVTLSAETQYLNFKKASTADVLASIISETDAGTGGKIRILTKRNGDTAINALTIDDNQNVGIGTSSPDASLDIEPSSGDADILLTAGSQTLRLDQNSIRTTTNNNLTLFTNGNSGQLVLQQSTGNVGIGVTSPAIKLDVVEAIRIQAQSGGTNNATLVLTARNGGAYGNSLTARSDIQSTTDGTEYGSNLLFKTTDSSNTRATRMTIDSSGNSTFSGNVNVNGTTGTPSISVRNPITGGNNEIFQRWQYVPNNTNFRLDLTQRETLGLVRYAFDLINNGTAYNSNLVLDRGKVGIGTDSPAATLDVAGNIYGVRLYVNSGGNATDPMIRVKTDTNTGIFFPAADTLAITTGGSERMRITSGGDVCVGTTTGRPDSAADEGVAIAPAGKFFIYSTSDFGVYNTNTTGKKIYFRIDNAEKGSIQFNTNSVAYNTTSDYRLKENVVEMTGALDRVSQLKPSRFN